LLLGSVLASGQEVSKHPCCTSGAVDQQVVDICLAPDEIRNRVRHLEPLRLSGVDRSVDITGTIVLDVRFGADGTFECTTAREGNPIAISAAILALPKWRFKPVTSGGSPRPACGRLTIRYRLSARASSTKLQ
jgi:hypothetical protein